MLDKIHSSLFPSSVFQTGMKNKVINGNFDIWQRGTTLATSGYLADRFGTYNTGSTFVASQQAFANGQVDVPNNPRYFHRVVVTSAANAANVVDTQHRIESVSTLAGKKVTFSFYAKADSNKNIAVSLSQKFGTGGSPSPQIDGIGARLLALTTVWTKYSFTVDLPSIAGKSLGTAGDDQLILFFFYDAGSNFNAMTASLGQQSGTFDIAQVQLEDGDIATDFEMRHIQTELALCQRYY